jgi:Transposase DDE domain group 1
VFGIALGYEDLIDHDQLRHDPVLATLAGKLVARRSRCAPLAGKSTLNRLELAPPAGPNRYHKIGHDGDAIARLFVDLCGSGRSGSRPQEPILLTAATGRAASMPGTRAIWGISGQGVPAFPKGGKHEQEITTRLGLPVPGSAQGPDHRL